jgi:hypothetical protein
MQSSFTVKADGKNSNQYVLKGLRQFLITVRKAERVPVIGNNALRRLDFYACQSKSWHIRCYIFQVVLKPTRRHVF